MEFTQAEQVEQVYYDAMWDDNIPSEGCYALAVAAALELGGIEIANSNDGSTSKSFAPTVEFEFNDASIVQITLSNVYFIKD